MRDSGKQMHAAVFYTNALIANPASAAATFGLMASVGAPSHLNPQLENGPANFAVSTQLAVLCFYQHDDVATVNLLRQALDADASHVPALITMGELLKSHGFLIEASIFYRRALNIDCSQSCAIRGLLLSAYYSKATSRESLQYFHSASLKELTA